MLLFNSGANKHEMLRSHEARVLNCTNFDWLAKGKVTSLILEQKSKNFQIDLYINTVLHDGSSVQKELKLSKV